MLDRIIAREGGAKVTNDPSDPGGLTKFGISKKSHPGVDIANLTYEDAKQIYMQQYVLGPKLHLINDLKTQEMLVDFGVHSGPATAVRHLQRIVGATQDGRLGPATLAKLDALPVKDVQKAITLARCVFLARQCQTTPSKLKYLTGWITRAVGLL